MFNAAKLIDSMQSDWPLLSSLGLIAVLEVPPPWVATSAQRLAARLTPGEIAACRAQLPLLIDKFAVLYQRWTVAAVLAVLLALAVVSAAAAAPLDPLRTGVLISVLSAILLPPLVICNGITRDYLAARSLAAALRTTYAESSQGLQR